MSAVELQPNQQLDKKKRQDFKSRVLCGIGILLFFLVFITLNAFADFNVWSMPNNNWFSFYEKLGFLIAGIVLLNVIIGLCAYEFNKVFYRNKKTTLIANEFLVLLACNASIVSTVLLRVYDVNTIKYFFWSTQNYWAINFALLFIVVLINILMLIKNNHLAKKQKLLAVLVLAITFLFFSNVYYLMLLRSWIIWSLIAVLVILTDTFAYVGGKLFGKAKIFPKISPKKTWAGFITGIVVASSIVFLLCVLVIWKTKTNNSNQDSLDLIHNHFARDFYGFKFLWSMTPNSWLVLFLLIMCFWPLLAITAVFGDLFFSYVKRSLEIKDFSNILKAHGGIYDRIDALMVTTVAYTFFALISDLF
ncbi:phosphatidate cytidylyltransferase [Ureaplasma miroungigenitalium]|uniref:Phosphatidate cytidylyltransferase n=1 Tax=Ureaplasma miroungigenitalium TaxID=1042321 RepID=A0ABT3BMB1_9BACT|nr:phosphatidate cytidylyltransferase [Ureaplasma miroungigenitalium]MCV3728381.1 phosphatidate cytidylyltransferase [Ureaplasma miroungigenitalium]MCV3734168.1 phosphatidate cytidylyltransferase [Ureaplasma miroungigenitalium]